MKRRIAVALLQLASRILPPGRRQWIHDMRGELDFLKSDHAALSWAFGCVLASLHERVIAMLSLHGEISRPVLILEWLTCFVPLTLLWVAVVNLIVSLDHVPPDLLLAAGFGTLGPIALIVSLRTTASKRNIDSRRYARLLVLGFAVMVLLQMLNAGVNEEISFQWLRFDFGTFVLVCLLPLFGALHFDRLVLPRQGRLEKME